MAPPARSEGDVYVAYVKRMDEKEAEPAIQTILGEYVERGVNHGRKVFQKTQQPSASGARALDVLVYYWDDRDGDKYEGWWFGNKLGGSQVWAHCKDSSDTPPLVGWQVPWNGYMRPEFAVALKEDKVARDTNQNIATLSELVEQAEISTEQASEQAQGIITGGRAGLASKLAEVEALLSPQILQLRDLEQKVTEAVREATGPSAARVEPQAVRELRQLGARIRAKKESVTAAFAKAKTKRKEVEDATKMKDQEEVDKVTWDDMLPEAQERVNAAEDAVETAIIALDNVQANMEEEGETDLVESLLDETEMSGRKAMSRVSEAHIVVKTHLTKTKNFAPRIREVAEAELGQLKAKVDEARAKLAPALVARKEWDNRREVQAVLGEVQSQLVLADLEVDQAEEAVLLLSGDPTEESLQCAALRLKAAEQHVERAVAAIDARLDEAVGGVAEALQARLQPRKAALRERLEKLRPSVDTGATQIRVSGYVQEARAKLEELSAAIRGVEEADAAADAAAAQSGEGDFQRVFATAEAKLRAPEAGAHAAHTVGNAAKGFLQMKVLELRRAGGEAVSESLQALQELQAQVDGSLKHLVEIRTRSSRRRRAALLKEAEGRVAWAEACVKDVGKAASMFGGSSGSCSSSSPATCCGLPVGMSVEQVREAAMAAASKERAATEAIAEARKTVTARQVEAKKEMSNEEASAVSSLQARLATLLTDLAGHRKGYSSVEQRLAGRRVVEEVEAKLRETDANIAGVLAAIAELPEEAAEGAAEEARKAEAAAVKAAEASSREAQLAIRMTTRALEMHSRLQGSAKEALAALTPRLTECQTRLDGGVAQLRDRTERAFVKGMLQEVRVKVDECESRLAEASEAEPPRVASEAEDPEAAPRAVRFERAVQAAQTAQSAAKTTITMKRLAAKRLSEASAARAEEALDASQRQVDAVAAKLVELRARLTEAKVALLRRGR